MCSYSSFYCGKIHVILMLLPQSPRWWVTEIPDFTVLIFSHFKHLHQTHTAKELKAKKCLFWYHFSIWAVVTRELLWHKPEQMGWSIYYSWCRLLKMSKLVSWGRNPEIWNNQNGKMDSHIKPNNHRIIWLKKIFKITESDRSPCITRVPKPCL